MAALRNLLLCCVVALASAFVPARVPGAVASIARPVLQQPAISMIALTKPQRTNLKNRAYNKMYKSEMKTAMKKVRVRPGLRARA